MVWDRDNLAGRLAIRDIVPEVRSAVREARDAGAERRDRRHALRTRTSRRATTP